MIAAKIIMLRMTPLSIARFTDFNTTATKLRPAANREGGNFGEKDERRVNNSSRGAGHVVESSLLTLPFFKFPSA
jgi:hypothetical protein